jgi:hypothetical protein
MAGTTIAYGQSGSCALTATATGFGVSVTSRVGHFVARIAEHRVSARSRSAGDRKIKNISQCL